MIWRRAAAWPRSIQWLGLVTLSTLLCLIWMQAGLPAGLLLGPMIAGIVCGVNGVRLAVARGLYLGAQGTIGAMVSASVTPALFAAFRQDAMLFCALMAVTLLGAAALGWLISRSGLIPGATAVYGTSPGAATAMVVLSEAEGADGRLVAFMQYSRVLLVAFAAAVVAHFWAGNSAPRAAATAFLGPIHWGHLALTLVLIAVGQQVARLLRLQAWALLGPLLVLSALHASGWFTIDLPRWLLAAGYAMVGWHIGLGFRAEALRHAGKAVPVVVGAALAMMTFCGILAGCLVRIAHVDPLTAYLATSPGGLDSVAIIAASTPRVDLPFVLALQSVRLIFVIGLAPLLTRLVVQHSPHLQPAAN